MTVLLGSALGLSLLGAPPVFVDARPEIPWIAVASPGPRCGSVRSIEGPRADLEKLKASVQKEAEQKPKTSPPAARLPLLPGPGLAGLEGELLVVALEQLLARHGISGPIVLHLEDKGAWLELPPVTPEAEAAIAVAAFSAAELTAMQDRASARLAKRRSTIGNWARERALRASCNDVVDDPALPLDLGRRLRARLSAPLVR
ncbi:MAG: hypothetical protein Q8O67_23095 [Deltaproteobacteria bacterium]|nr:hypothetical protein [Deltaproteobacteria bacterium]